MVSDDLLNRVAVLVEGHVRCSKGFEEESFVNPFTPADSVSAYCVAQSLTDSNAFDVCISVAPEGHVYGYFFELFGASILSVHVGYPPKACTILDDFSRIGGKRVLILEDDVASGTTLRLVLEAIEPFDPAAIDLFLGRPKRHQILDHIDSRIGHVYLAEDVLVSSRRDEYESRFTEAFSTDDNG